MAQPQALPPVDDHSDEDTLRPPSARLSDAELRALLAPRPGSLIRGTGERLVRPPGRHITCATSVADAVVEDRG